MKESIWLINHYATSMYKNQGGRHYWFAENLQKQGYNPTIFCSNQFHANDESIDLGRKRYKVDRSGKFPFVFVKSTPYTGNGLSRIRNMYSFYRNLFPVTKEYIKQNGKPDIILASSVHPLTLVAGIKIARRLKVPCICEVRDLWPESIFEYGSLKKNSILGRLLQAGEKWIYKKADAIIFTIEGNTDYLKEQKWDLEQSGCIDIKKCYYINNGIDMNAFDNNLKNFKIDDEDLDDSKVFKLIYTGSIKHVNNLGLFVDVARKLVEMKNIKILIWGTGDELEILKKQVRTEKLENIVFKGFVEKKYIPYILSKADVNISHCRQTNILRFGTSQNKDFDYLASGKPILRTIRVDYDIVANTNSGLCVEVQSVDNIKKTILDFFRIATENKELYNEMCRNARKTAEEYDFKVLTKKLIDIIEAEL